MKISATASSYKDFQDPEPGTYPAVCVKVIDLGTQQTVYKGEKKQKHKLKIVWELSELMSDGRPFLAMRDFTVSLGQTSALRPFLAGWRGRDFTEEELQGFDLKNLLGKGCLLSLVQENGFLNVASAAKLPKGMEAPTPVSPLVMFSLSEFKRDVFEALSPKLQQRIMQSPEYQKVSKQSSPATDTAWDEEESF